MSIPTEQTQSKRHIISEAGPSLALIKYWGKRQSAKKNTPSTTNIGITLDTLTSRVKISDSSENEFILDDEAQDFSKITELQEAMRMHAFYRLCIPSAEHCLSLRIEAENNFPTASGLASSASGFAALAAGLSHYYLGEIEARTLPVVSELAREGSGSACRSVFGGFTVWKKGSKNARELFPKEHWSELRVIVLAPYEEKKNTSSREGMIHCQKSSPYYKPWMIHNETLAHEMIMALSKKDIEKVGTLMRASYTAMHACAIASQPSLRYWRARSLEILDEIDILRTRGLPAWETMDAGPQVKILTLDTEVEVILSSLLQRFPNIWYAVCAVGDGVRTSLIQ